MKTFAFLFMLLVVGTNQTILNAQDYFPKKVRRHYVYVDKAGNQVFERKFQSAMRFHEGLAAVSLDDKWGFIDEEGQTVIDIKYDKVKSFEYGRAVVVSKETYSIINTEGEPVTASYDTIYSKSKFYVMREEGLLGLMDSLGGILEEPKFEVFGSYFNDKLTVKYKGEWGTWGNNELDTSDPDLYLISPEDPPVFSEHCESFKDPKERKKCSETMVLTAIFKNIRYPAEARQKGIQGRVFIQFVIDKNGEGKDFKIVRSIGGGCDEEALRVVSSYLHKWSKPGIQDGVEVNTIFYMPIHFRLE